QLTGKLRHAATAIPAGRGLFSPFNAALVTRPRIIYREKRVALWQALEDWKTILKEVTRRATHVQ
ncbi:MAG: hypothetical protein ACREBR_01950, partial [bacterium]